MDWTWYLFRFEGRINRAKLWLACPIIICWMIFLAGVALAAGLFGDAKSIGFSTDDLFKVIDPDAYHSLSAADLPFLLTKTAATTLFLWMYFATSIKRLHDLDKSGWWMVPFFLAPGLFNQFEDQLSDSYAVMLLGLVALALLLWGFIEMYFLKGSPKTNRFGPNPLAPHDTRPGWQQQSELESVPHTASPPPVWHVKREA